MKIIHWIISIVAAVFLGMAATAILATIAYLLYLLVVEARAVAVFVLIAVIAYWIGSYIENHGWAWNPIDDIDTHS